MANLSGLNTFVDGAAVLASEHNANWSAVSTLLNSTGLDASGLATNSVTTDKILAANVTTAKIADSAVTTAKIADANVTTAKIADASVTQAKRATLGQQVSSSSATFSSSSTSFVDVTNLTVTITTTDRPVFIGFISDGTSNLSGFYASGNDSAADPAFAIYRDATLVCSSLGPTRAGASPAGSLTHIDIPSAGTYTYKLQTKVVSAGASNVHYLKMIAYEL